MQVGFTSLDAAAARGDFDIGLSGIEDSAGAPRAPGGHHPVLRVPRGPDRPRRPTRARFRTLADLRGRRVATLGATLAYDLLVEAQAEHGVVPVTYEDDVHPYSDLALGRVDAVLLDEVLAERGVRRNAGLVNQADRRRRRATTSASSRRQRRAARSDRTTSCAQAMRDGRLEAIFRRWEMWNDDQPRLYARVLAGESRGQPVGAVRPRATRRRVGVGGGTRATCRRCCAPRGITLVLSCLSMALAVARRRR